MKPDNDEDVYEESNLDGYVDDDEMSSGEAAFMEGYDKADDEKNGKKKNTSKSSLKSYPYPDWLNMELWAEFCDQRAKSKHPITSSTGITRLLNSLKKLIDEGHAQDDIIGLALERGWRGFFPPSDFNRSDELSETEKHKREKICRRLGIA